MINTTFESIERKKFFAFQQFSFNKQLSKVVFNSGAQSQLSKAYHNNIDMIIENISFVLKYFS